MARMVDYYEILGVPRNSEDVEIKRAYRRLALKHHPDADAADDAAELFSAVGEAYDVLANPRTKGIYDLYGYQQLKAGVEGTAPYHFDAAEGPKAVFARFFGTANPYEALEVLSTRFQKLTAPKDPPKQEPKRVELPVSLEELARGGAKVVQFTRQVYVGSDSSGSGGSGCEAARVAVEIEPGMAEGTVFLFEREGDTPAPGKARGPLELVLRAAPHARFQRRGADLALRAQLPLCTALVGGTVDVPTLDGRVLSVPLGGIVAPGTVVRVPGEGLPKPGAAGAKGDLLLEAELVFPSHLTQQQKLLLRAAFFLPPKPNEAQAKALRAFESAFRDSKHGWSTGVLPAAEGS